MQQYRIYQDYDKHWVVDKTVSPGIFKRIFGIKEWYKLDSTRYNSSLKTDKDKVEQILKEVAIDISSEASRRARDAFVPVYTEFSEEAYLLGKVTIKEVLKK